MSKGSFFSGLVQGFGSGMADMHRLKLEQDRQAHAEQLQILMAAAQNPMATGSVKRAAFKAMLGPNAALADVLFPNQQVQVGTKMVNGQVVDDGPGVETPQPVMAPMPQRPQMSGPMVPPEGRDPRQNSIADKNGNNSITYDNTPPSSPLDPGYQGSQPQQSPFSGGLFNQQDEGPAPVTRAATGGIAANPTNAMETVEMARRLLKVMPARPQAIMRGTDDMTEGDITQARQLQTMQAQSDIQTRAGQSNALWEMQNIKKPLMQMESEIRSEEMMREVRLRLSAIPAETQAKIIGKLNGTINAAKLANVPLTPADIKQVLDIATSPAETDSARRTQLELDSHSDIPEVRQGALREIAAQNANIAQSQASALNAISSANNRGSEESPAAQRVRLAQIQTDAIRRARVALSTPAVVEARAKQIFESMGEIEQYQKGMTAARTQARADIQLQLQSVSSEIALAVEAGKEPILVSEALAKYKASPNPNGVTFEQFLAELESHSEIHLVDDGTPREPGVSAGGDNPLGEINIMKGKKSKPIPGHSNVPPLGPPSMDPRKRF